MGENNMSTFQHGVASGDPLPHRVILWTRVTVPHQNPVDVQWEIAEDAAFTRGVQSGSTCAYHEDDHTVSVDPAGLRPSTRYFYRFHAEGETSLTGRTKTLPETGATHLRFAQASCAKFNAGYFNAYARMAERDDLDFLLHLGDYIYEASNTPPAGQTPGADIGRPFEPLHECKTLEDYRTRYGQYHRDPDVQAMHAALPLIATVDDHEFADGAWRGGADVHDENRDGAWSDRLKTCFRARAEWLPVRHPDPDDPARVYRKVELGGLADIFLINTRTHRDQPIPPPEMYEDHRTALGHEQREWLFREFAESKARWRVLGNPSVLSTTWKENYPEDVKLPLLKTKLIASDGKSVDYDQWDGYPAERRRLFELFRQHRGNIVVLSGDIHVCMAFELKGDPFDEGEEVSAVEFINTSLTSQNLDDKMKWAARTDSLKHEDALLRAFPHLKWCDLDSHGFNIVDVTPERVQVEYWLVDTVLQRTKDTNLGAIWEVKHGVPKLQQVA
jgi:alkaline phosphatase D